MAEKGQEVEEVGECGQGVEETLRPGELARYQYSLDQLEGTAEEVKAELNDRGKLSDNLPKGKKNVWDRIM